MIDGVNVAGCVRLQDDEISCDLGGECKGWENCYFKQLARKTHECESLKQEIEILQNNYDTATRDCNEEIARLEQECEELKERLERIEEDLKYQCVDCMNVKSDRYHKALEEIEKVCIEDTRIFADGTEVRYDSLDDILDIINKAKGGV